MADQLNPNGNPVPVGRVVLRTPGLTGQAKSHPAVAPGMRAAEQPTPEFEEALARELVEPFESVEIAGAREVPVSAAAVRTTALGEPAIELSVEDSGPNWGQFVLYTDESGVTTWNFARDGNLALDPSRGRGERTYVIRRHVAPAPDPRETRGLIGALGKKILKVLVFPIVDRVIGEVGDYFASRWEAAKRPYRIRLFQPDDYRSEEAVPVQDVTWSDLAQGPALMFVHGTFVRSHVGFRGIPRHRFEELYRMYEGRVFAFDHFTLSDDPRQNVEWLFKHIPNGADLELDIVCHSRGGLVSRVLAEKQAEVSLGAKSVTVRKIVFVATPNAGTALADPDHMNDFIDSYTNILNFFPDTGIVEVLEGIITVAKQLAVGTVRGLEGLQSMNPQGRFLADWMNTGARIDGRYFALAANYEPAQSGLAAYKDAVMDRIFGRENDLVVPTSGVYDQNGSAMFPIDERLEFPGRDGIQHSSFFSNPTAMDKLQEWLRT
jgi:hypothetical protein